MALTIGEVARVAHVTVRTLHHYDDIGLLRPSARSAAGYRLYEDADLERLQQILCYRELGFELDKIAAVLDDPDTDPVEHLRRQRVLLTERVERLQEMVAAVEKTMDARRMGISLTPEELFEVFGEDDPTVHADEVEQRWGSGDAFRSARERTASYSKDDWLRLTAEMGALDQRFAEALRAGEPPTGELAMDIAEQHRRHIDRWFYDCSHGTHERLAEMYVADPRFRERYEAIAPGLAAYVRSAVVANARRHAPAEADADDRKTRG